MKMLIRLVITVLGFVFVTSTALSQQVQNSPYGPDMWHGGWSGWFMGPFMMIIILVVAVVVIVLIVRFLGGAGHSGTPHVPPGRTALDILKERYARGEIDKAEFEERRRVIGD